MHFRISQARFVRVSTVVGAFIWLLTLLIHTGDSPETELIQKVLLFATLVIVPLALSILSSTKDWLALRLAIFVQPVAALLCCASFLTSQGVVAGILVLPWFATTTLIALTGLMRVLFAPRRLDFGLSVSAGMLYLSVGGAWLVASRLGLQPLGFGDTIVLLTAVHFHFAGFVAPIVVGLTGQYLRNREMPSTIAVVAAAAIVSGTPIVAAGITLSPALALAGALIVTLGLTLLAFLLVSSVVPTLRSATSRILLVIASLSTFVAMVLASLYAYSIVTHKLLIDIPHMAMTHGLLNCFGFALCSLSAWVFSSPELNKAPRT